MKKSFVAPTFERTQLVSSDRFAKTCYGNVSALHASRGGYRDGQNWFGFSRKENCTGISSTSNIADSQCRKIDISKGDVMANFTIGDCFGLYSMNKGSNQAYSY